MKTRVNLLAGVGLASAQLPERAGLRVAPKRGARRRTLQRRSDAYR
jgi:hypothetical protein